MEDLLTDWGFEKLIQHFKENDVTMENIFKLNDEMIKELIPSVGLRVNFKEKFKKAIPAGSESPTLEEGIYIIDKNGELDRTNESVLSYDTNSDVTESEFNEGSPSTSVIPLENRQVAFCGIENFFAAISPVFPDFDLKTLLQTSPLGNSILTFYQANQCLDHTRRSRLVDIIMKHIFNFIIKHRLKHDDYNVITSKIISLFPKETVSTYYVSSIQKKKSYIGKSIIARGRLVDKCRNLLHVSGAST